MVRSRSESGVLISLNVAQPSADNLYHSSTIRKSCRSRSEGGFCIHISFLLCDAPVAELIKRDDPSGDGADDMVAGGQHPKGALQIVEPGRLACLRHQHLFHQSIKEVGVIALTGCISPSAGPLNPVLHHGRHASVSEYERETSCITSGRCRDQGVPLPVFHSRIAAL
jgi:hypothetical protein